MHRPRPVLPSFLNLSGLIRFSDSLASESLKMPQAFSCTFYSLECSGVEQYTRLIAVLRNAVTLQIQIR